MNTHHMRSPELRIPKPLIKRFELVKELNRLIKKEKLVVFVDGAAVQLESANLDLDEGTISIGAHSRG